MSAATDLPALAVCGSSLDGTAAFSVAVRTATGVAVAAPAAGQRGDLATLTRTALQQAGVAAGDLRTVLVDIGPGSYIGLRVAATFARCLAAFGGARLLAIDSLAAVAVRAAAADPAHGARRLLPVLDGRQGRLQVGAFRVRAGGLEVEQPSQVLADAELAALLRPEDLVLAAAALAPRLDGILAARGARRADLPALRAEHLFLPGIPAVAVAPMALEPVYLAGSYVGEAPG